MEIRSDFLEGLCKIVEHESDCRRYLETELPASIERAIVRSRGTIASLGGGRISRQTYGLPTTSEQDDLTLKIVATVEKRIGGNAAFRAPETKRNLLRLELGSQPLHVDGAGDPTKPNRELEAADLEVAPILSGLDAAGLRSWLEPFLEKLELAVHDEVFKADPEKERRVDRDRQYLHSELYESADDEVRTQIVVAILLDLIGELMSSAKDEAGADFVKNLATSREKQFGPEQAIEMVKNVADHVEDRHVPAGVVTIQWVQSNLGWIETLVAAGSITILVGAIETGSYVSAALGAIFGVLSFAIHVKRRSWEPDKSGDEASKA